MAKLLRQETLQKPREKVNCEICGQVVLKDYAFSYYILMATTGHAYIQGFDCENVQHWGCSPDHALEAAIICAREHLHPGLISRHQESDKPWYSSEDEIAYERNKNFHRG